MSIPFSMIIIGRYNSFSSYKNMKKPSLRESRVLDGDRQNRTADLLNAIGKIRKSNVSNAYIYPQIVLYFQHFLDKNPNKIMRLS